METSIDESTQSVFSSQVYTINDVHKLVEINTYNQQIEQQNQSHDFEVEKERYKAGKTRPGETRCLELGCNFKCTRITQLRTHLAVHGIIHEPSDRTFASERDFERWLSEVENEGKCTFMRRRGWQRNKNGSKTACFYCHRGGAYTSKASKKRSKVQGSCKTGVECTASMKVIFWPETTPDGRPYQRAPVEVEAYLQHYGHNTDLEHTRITKEEKVNIAKKLSSGLSRNKVLDEIRETLDVSSSPNRLHLISIQDIYNIEKVANLKANRRKSGSKPGTTVQEWIEKMQMTEDNPVLLVKYQKEKATASCACLNIDDFILVMQTPLQAKLLKRHGHQSVVCFDITRGDQEVAGKDEPRFYLACLSVILPSTCDFKEEICPVAWFVCNRNDRAVIGIFLHLIKANLRKEALTPSQLILPSPGITSSCDWFEIWTTTFGGGPFMLYGSWHVSNDWKNQINSIPNIRLAPVEISRLMANMLTVLQERNLEHFNHLKDEFIADLRNNSSTHQLALYFEKHFSPTPFTWASAYRNEQILEVDQRFEEFNRNLCKTIYPEGFKRKQLDILVKTLLKYSRDKTLAKLRSSYKRNNSQYIKEQTKQQHTSSDSIPTNHVSKSNDFTWSVVTVVDAITAEDREQPAVKQIMFSQTVKLDCNRRCTAQMNCPYRCDECQICSHYLTCDCEFAQETGLMCEHSHLVCRYQRESDQDMVEVLSKIENQPQYSSTIKKSNDVAEEADDMSSDQIVVYVLTEKD